MTLFLDEIDSIPVIDKDIAPELMQWLWVLVDSLNENTNDIEGVVSSFAVVPGITQAVEINSTYVPTNAALTTFTLPDLARVGSRVEIDGQGTGGWILLTGAGQTIEVASVPKTAITSIASTSRYDSISIICVKADTTWIVVSAQTTGFVIV